MARQRVYTKDELLDATERLLLERGYDGFQMKALSATLKGARSTIYEYFAGKDEIVAACMRRSMERTLAACEGLERMEPVAAIRKLLSVFLERAGFHTLMQSAPRVGRTSSERARADLDYLESAHEALKSRLMSLFARAQAEGALRSDIPLAAVTAVFFHAIDTPNWLGLPAGPWSEVLFDMWWHGCGNGR